VGSTTSHTHKHVNRKILEHSNKQTEKPGAHKPLACMPPTTQGMKCTPVLFHDSCRLHRWPPLAVHQLPDSYSVHLQLGATLYRKGL
jgi:hypothetical protein